MSGYVDLHCHYLPGIDDGVRTLEDGVALLRRLFAIGFGRVVATPHMRSGMFDNDRPRIEAAFADFRMATSEMDGLPELGLGAEHYVDDVFLERFRRRSIVPYTGNHAALVELPPDAFPLALEGRFFEMSVKRVRPVLAHPERYAPLFQDTEKLDPLLDQGVLPLLDVMSLVGHYGKAPQRAAERMLDEGVYFAACSDCHRVSDVERVEEGIERLMGLVGRDEAEEMLRENPRKVLSGTFAG